MTRSKTGVVCKWGASILVLLLILGYSIFNSRIFITGPQIEILSPVNGATVVDSPLVFLEGTARNISNIQTNDKLFPINSDGHFREPLLLRPGYNIILITAKDKFGRSIEDKIELFYDGEIPEIQIQEEIIETPIESLENI